MANSYYYTDGDGNSHTLYIAGTSTTVAAIRDTQRGDDNPIPKHTLERTGNPDATVYRFTTFQPREYSAQFLLYTSSSANLETAVGNWNQWHNPMLGEGELKRITAGGNTRVLDCIPDIPSWAKDGPFNRFVTQIYRAANPWWRSESQTTADDAFGAAITVANSGFEVGGTGGDFNGGAELDDGTSDDFTSWTETNDDGAGNKTEATATVQAGSAAAKLTWTNGLAQVAQAIVSIPAEIWHLSFYSQGDASVAGRFRVYDNTNAANIVATKETGVTAAAYAEVTEDFTIPTACVETELRFLNPSSAGVGYFDVVTITRTTVQIAVANAGTIPTWPVITITGVVDTPKFTNEDGDYISTDAVSVNADDTIVIDHRPGHQGIFSYVHGVGTGTPEARTDGSTFFTLPVGTSYVACTRDSGGADIEIAWYSYFGSLS